MTHGNKIRLALDAQSRKIVEVGFGTHILGIQICVTHGNEVRLALEAENENGGSGCVLGHAYLAYNFF